DSHWEWRLGLGRSLTGRYEKTGESEQVIADFYTIRGIKFNDATYQTTDDFINAIRAGIAKDVSIGFHGGEFVCSVCGLDMWSWDCWHIPGLEYDIKDKNGDVIRREEAFAWVAKARLAEVSVVYKGATPGAAILKAQQEAEAGRLTPQQARFLENRYRAIKLVIPRIEASGTRESEPAAVKPSPEPAEQEQNERRTTMETKSEDQATGPDPLAGIRTLLTGAGRDVTN